MALTTYVLKLALVRWTQRLDDAAQELNQSDGQLGDGDLGVTLVKCAANVRCVLPEFESDLGSAFRLCTTACSKASGSSFGTLLAVAFMTASKHTAGKSELAWEDLPDLLQAVLEAMSARGGAALGDKTVLDTLAAAQRAIRSLSEPQAQLQAARMAVDAVIDEFRQKPNRIGRARMFAERSIGLDDPGMIAFRHMLESLATVG